MTNDDGAPTRRNVGAPIVALLILLLTGCSSAQESASLAGALVPWDPAVPAALQPSPTPSIAPACRATALKVVGAGFMFTAAASGGTGQVTLRNSSSAPCRLTGRPDVRIVGAQPSPEQTQTPLPAAPVAFPAVVPPEDQLLALSPGAAAMLGVEWRNWCVPASAKNAVPPQAIRLTLPGAGSLDVGYNAVPVCETPPAPSTIGVRPFQPAPLAATSPWTTVALQATVQSVDGGAGPLTGKPGETVRFAVLLRNPSTVPVTFEHCPLVVEMLAPSGHPEVTQLNCRAAGALPPGGSLRFEMRIRIPAHAPAGNNGLFWELDPTGAQGPEAVSRVVVAG